MLDRVRSDSPLYLLQTDQGFVTFPVLLPDGIENALAIFTGKPEALKYARRCPRHCVPLPLKSMTRLSQELTRLPAEVKLLGINPLSEEECEQVIQVQTLLQVIEESWFVWDYPLFLLRQERKYVCLMGNVQGLGTIKPLCLFTDEDLAERYSHTNARDCQIEQIKSASAFLTLLRRLPTSLEAVVFDPPDNRSQKSGRWCVKKRDLFDILQGELIRDGEF